MYAVWGARAQLHNPYGCEIRISFCAVPGETAVVVQLLLIVNPFASSVSPRTQVLVQRALGESHDVQVVETTRRNHATRLAEDAARRGIDGIVVLGGDGTVNEVANGVVDSYKNCNPSFTIRHFF